MEKYKKNDTVICNGNVGNLLFNQVKGKVIRRNGFTGHYLIKFTSPIHEFIHIYQIELHEDQIEHINKVVLIPSGEVIDIDENKYNEYLNKKIIRWDDENDCYILPDTFKNSL